MTLRDRLARMDQLNEKLAAAEADYVLKHRYPDDYNRRVDDAYLAANAFARNELGWTSNRPVMDALWVHDFIIQTLMSYNDDTIARGKS